jgi:hypothetical protein
VLGADCDPARRAEDIAATVPTSRTTRAFVDGPRATGTLTELASATELRAAFGCVPPDLDLRRDHVWVASWESSPEVAEVPWSFVHAGGYATLGLRVENVPCHGDNRGDSRDARLVFAAPAGETAELVRCPAPPRGACGEVP